MKPVRLWISCLVVSFTLGLSHADKDQAKTDGRAITAKPLTEKQKKKREEKLRRELETPYKKWLSEDVAYIITDGERQAFKGLNTDDEREQFIEQFWLRRDPTPETEDNEFHMTMDPSEKDALLYSPTGGLTVAEQRGLVAKDQNRFWTRTDGTHLGAPVNGYSPVGLDEFSRLEQFTKLLKPPPVKFKDLEAAVTTHVTFNLLPLKVQADYIKVTNSSVLTNITLQVENRDLEFQLKDGVQKAVVNIYGRITTMSRRVANVFEDTVTLESPAERLQALLLLRRWSLYQKSLPLSPGTYRLNIVVKDVVGGNMNNYEMALNVPRYDDENLASSTVVLADVIEKVSTRSIGAGQFVLGSSKVRPRLDDTFRYDEKMGIYLQLYNFSPDEKTQKPNGTIEYEVVRTGTNEKIFNFTEEIAKLPGASAQQVTIEKLLPLEKVEPGQYTLKMKVTDRNRNQTLTPTATFRVIYN